MLTLALILAQVIVPKGDTSAHWIETPVPHWSCPVDMRLVETLLPKPVCGAANRFIRDIEGVNYTSQELIHWDWLKTVPKNGKLRVTFPPEFLHQPGCEVTDLSDSANVMRFSDESKEGFTIHSKAGHDLSLKCRGVINR